MDPSQPTQLDILAVTLVDLRATIDAQKRCIVSAQASAEEFRAGGSRASLDDIADTLAQLDEHARALNDGLKETMRLLRELMGEPIAGSEPSSV
jgi:hypothetical protein